ncbi:MAG: flagellar basal body-associated FliL family protein [Myxococcales bacterium]|nr:flagellar basal body-associated FliL family protein [Myxococcales bacterium]
MSDDIDSAPKKKGPPMIAIAAAGIVVIGGGVAFAMLKGKSGGAEAHSDGAGKHSTEKLGQVVALEGFIVNLNESRSTRYLKTTFSVELDETTDVELKERKDIVRDTVITYLSGLTVDDVRGSETKPLIRDELLRLVNEAVGKPKGIRSVRFTEFVVQ